MAKLEWKDGDKTFDVLRRESRRLIECAEETDLDWDTLNAFSLPLHEIAWWSTERLRDGRKTALRQEVVSALRYAGEMAADERRQINDLYGMIAEYWVPSGPPKKGV
ncbi:MAG: hypothetical protein H5U20_04145, partial [Rhodobacteraceae bacterium]|nr:hypothetical protein [Paracoccaceae bacterium]